MFPMLLSCSVFCAYCIQSSTPCAPGLDRLPFPYLATDPPGAFLMYPFSFSRSVFSVGSGRELLVGAERQLCEDPFGVHRYYLSPPAYLTPFASFLSVSVNVAMFCPCHCRDASFVVPLRARIALVRMGCMADQPMPLKVAGGATEGSLEAAWILYFSPRRTRRNALAPP